ncbi:MAG: mandelate racemase/muconate lactonizing enzyme family protein [Pseudomonadota bacterium]
MKLQSIETYVVGNPPPSRGGRYFVFVRLETACGISGVGEIYNATFSPHVVAEMARDVFARIFDGEDPHHVERLWRATYGAGYTLRPDVSVMGVLSALEMACWDIIGKAADKPVYQLLGGLVHEKLRTYTYLYPPGDEHVYPDPDKPNVYNDPDIAAEIALYWVDEGFTAIKFDPAGPYTVYDGHQPSLDDLERSELFCKRIREAVGTRADLLFGTHGQFTVSGAKRMARRLEAYDPLWFEEPVPPEMPERMAEVARATSIPISTGERLCTKYEFARVLETGAASILQMDLGRVGGLLEAKKIAAMAETHYAQIAPHLYCGPIVGAANIQLAACSPNFLILESIQKWDGFHAELLTKPPQWRDGYVIPPSEPGLGVELDLEVARSNPYEGNILHLTMETQPLR